jgi:hypothetical protein
LSLKQEVVIRVFSICQIFASKTILEQVSWNKSNVITDYTKVKHTNITTIYKDN